MIQNDTELNVTRDRIAYFFDLLAKFRVSSKPEEYPYLNSAARSLALSEANLDWRRTARWPCRMTADRSWLDA
jgi:hypothetical protein